MRIAVFGDSFADRTNVHSKSSMDDESWIYFIQEELKCEIDSFGYSGTSMWWSYTRFLERYGFAYDAIIFTYSSIGRIHHLPDHLDFYSFIKTFDSAENLVDLPKTEKKEFLTAVELYFKYFYTDELDTFICQSIFDNINNICKKNDIKLLNFLPFECNFSQTISNINFDNRVGSCFTSALDISSGELDMLGKYEKRDIFFKNGDSRFCHLTRENNKILAHKFIDEILNPTNSVIQLKVEEFTFSKNNMKRYAGEII